MRHGIIWVTLACMLVLACADKDDSTAIRNLIKEGAGLAEMHHIGDLLRLTTDTFIAMPGRHDANGVKGILFVAFKHYGQFSIHYPKPAVEIETQGPSASAKVYFIIVRRDRTIPGLKELYNDPRRWLETAGEMADLYQLDLDLIKDKGQWLVQKARLEGFKGMGF